eukprot:TRINITY_DN1739_c0_g1_i1.p1 TRINITY_DN1739_c0_g1~~TRINITY_DN1739_c0_g1_i1.p1  ORF type:complete len:911 (+),score=370.56 TRINITY_DN1739_c0_g1_i1:84-2816(+)
MSTQDGKRMKLDEEQQKIRDEWNKKRGKTQTSNRNSDREDRNHPSSQRERDLQRERRDEEHSKEDRYRERYDDEDEKIEERKKREEDKKRNREDLESIDEGERYTKRKNEEGGEREEDSTVKDRDKDRKDDDNNNKTSSHSNRRREEEERKREEEEYADRHLNREERERMERRRRREKMEKTRKNLPIFQFREDLLSAIGSGQTLIVIGETGSGKSTQISQYMYEGGYAKNGDRIGITQPRRVGAVSVSRRVAEEMDCEVGDRVGYSVRFGDQTGRNTLIKYMTDGVLLRECLMDPDLREYSVIILDEAHERSVNTDILFGLMKMTLRRRKDLKVLITSATLDQDKFSSYFDDSRVFFCPGRSFPVEIFYLEDSEKDFVHKAVQTAIRIHEEEEEGDILIFLTGQQEIEQACDQLEKEMDKVYKRNEHVMDMIIVPLYAALPPAEQSRVFTPAPKGARKVVVATNIAETSLTVEGVVYVIDPGYVKQTGYNPTTGMETLEVVKISQVAAQQRAGRGGRTRPGKCFRLYTKSEYDEFAPSTVPEIQRTNLSNVILTLKAMGVKDILSFQFLDPPDPVLLIQAMKQLFFLGALDESGNLTSIGKKMSSFPLDPTYSRALIASVELGCVEDMLSLVAMFSLENLFYRSGGKEGQVLSDDRRRELFGEFANEIPDNLSGDHVALLHLYDSWKDSGKSQKFCQHYYIHPKSMQEAEEIRKQLKETMTKEKLSITQKGRKLSERVERLSHALCYGLYLNCGKRMMKPPPKNSRRGENDHVSGYSEYQYIVMNKNQVALVHPQCSLLLSPQSAPPEWVVYGDLVMTTRIFMRSVCGVKESWVEELHKHKSKLDVNKLIGRDIREVVNQLSVKVVESQSLDSKFDESHADKAFARRNDDAAIQAARERALARKQAAKK